MIIFEDLLDVIDNDEEFILYQDTDRIGMFYKSDRGLNSYKNYTVDVIVTEAGKLTIYLDEEE
jgi:hypothetical protein